MDYTAREAPVTLPACSDDPRRELPPVMYASLTAYRERHGMRRFAALGAKLEHQSELARGWAVYMGCLVRQASRGLGDPRDIRRAVDKLFSSP